MKTLLTAVACLLSFQAFAQRTIENVSLDKPVAAASMKPNVIYHGMRVVSFQDWNNKYRSEKSVLNLFPDYKEPTLLKDRDGVRKTETAFLTMFIARSSFIVNKPASAIKSQDFINVGFLQRIDPTIEHKQITEADLITYKVEAQKQNRLQGGNWCEGARGGICLDSTYKYPAVIASVVGLYNAFKAAKKDPFSRTQSELRAIPSNDLNANDAVQKLTGVKSQVSAGIEQNMFYFNQMMQFGTIKAFIQENPTNPQQSIITAFFALGVETHIFEQFGTSSALGATNLQPKQYIMGESPFNRNQSGLGAGLPTYTRSMSDLMAKELEK